MTETEITDLAANCLRAAERLGDPASGLLRRAATALMASLHERRALVNQMSALLDKPSR